MLACGRAPVVFPFSICMGGHVNTPCVCVCVLVKCLCTSMCNMIIRNLFEVCM